MLASVWVSITPPRFVVVQTSFWWLVILGVMVREVASLKLLRVDHQTTIPVLMTTVPVLHQEPPLVVVIPLAPMVLVSAVAPMAVAMAVEGKGKDEKG